MNAAAAPGSGRCSARTVSSRPSPAAASAGPCRCSCPRPRAPGSARRAGGGQVNGPRRICSRIASSASASCARAPCGARRLAAPAPAPAPAAGWRPAPRHRRDPAGQLAAPTAEDRSGAISSVRATCSSLQGDLRLPGLSGGGSGSIGASILFSSPHSGSSACEPDGRARSRRSAGDAGVAPSTKTTHARWAGSPTVSRPAPIAFSPGVSMTTRPASSGGCGIDQRVPPGGISTRPSGRTAGCRPGCSSSRSRAGGPHRRPDRCVRRVTASGACASAAGCAASDRHVQRQGCGCAARSASAAQPGLDPGGSASPA